MATYRHRATRARLTFKPASAITHSNSTDHLVGDYRRARNARAGDTRLYEAACARIGEVNRHKVAWKRLNQQEAFRALNVIRGVMRRNERAFRQASDALIALGMDLALLEPRKFDWLAGLIPSEACE